MAFTGTSNRLLRICLTSVILAFSGIHDASAADLRTWTDSMGRTIQAAFQALEGDNVILRLSSGQTVPYPLTKLSARDQDFARSQIGGATPAPGSLTNGTSPAARAWPDSVQVSSRAIEVAAVAEKPDERKFIYRSEAFEFTSQAKIAVSVMKEVARTFEATRALVSQSPWGIRCVPPEGLERYQAALYETRNDYVAAGGPANSGGVYQSGEKIFRIPFPSLGMEKRGQTWFMNSDSYKNDTLVHEITHQMMHDYLPFLPTWIIEGTAEYTEMLPYNAGKFLAGSHQRGLKGYIDDHAKFGLAPDIGSVQLHMTMNRDAWSAQSASSEKQHMLYFRSLLLVYYFNHLDDDKKGTRFFKFMDAVNAETAAMREFFANPAVKRLDGGRFTYPSSLKPPDLDPSTAPFKHFDILLDGRSYEQLATEIVAGFKTIGMKVSAN